MRRLAAAITLVLPLALAACSQQAAPTTSPSPYADRPELQDAGSQAILARYGNDPGLTSALQEAYGERPGTLSYPSVPTLNTQDYASDRLAYVKRTGWGTVSNYNAQYNAYAGTSSPYTGLDWTRDGCSAPTAWAWATARTSARHATCTTSRTATSRCTSAPTRTA